MKFIKITLKILFVFIILVAVGLFIFIKTFDINKYKDKIVMEISSALDREVQIGLIGLTVSLDKGIHLEVDDAVMLRRPDFQTDPLVKIKKIQLSVDIRKLLAERSSDDFMNHIRIESIDVTDAQVSLMDETFLPPLDISLNKINVQIKEFSLTQPFSFKMKSSLWSSQQNIHLKGRMRLDQKNNQVHLQDVDLRFKLKDFIVSEIIEAIPSLVSVGIQESLRGDVRLSIGQAVVGDKGLISLKADGEIVDGRVALASLAYPIDNIDMRLNVTEKDLNISELFFYLASGQVDGKAKVVNYIKNPKTTFNVQLENIQLKELFLEEALPIKGEGKLFGRLEGSFESFDSEQIMASLQANGNVELKEGKITDVNLLRMVLDKISIIPNLAQKVENNLSQKQKQQLEIKDTILTKAFLDINIQNKILVYDSLDVAMQGVLVSAQGNVTMDERCTFKGEAVLDKDLSLSLIKASEEFEGLQDKNNQIHIPLRSYSGPLKKFNTYPDLEDFGKKVLINKGKQELQKVLRKALGVKDEIPPVKEENFSEQDKDSQKPQEVQKLPIEEILIDTIFDAIFQ